MSQKALLFVWLLTAVCISSSDSKRHVILLTSALTSQRFRKELDMGEPLGEVAVESAEACGALCHANPNCHTVMYTQPYCRMFGTIHCPCPADFIYIPGHSSYLLRKDTSINTFQLAMDTCASLGWGMRSVHINSAAEHLAIKAHIAASGLSCVRIWTGGRTTLPGSPDMAHWNWHLNSDPNGPSVPFTYVGWQEWQPNNSGGSQTVLMLEEPGYDFNDIDEAGSWLVDCYMCECDLQN